VWAVSIGNANITTGLTPWNSKTLAQSGSQAKGFAGATPLTNMTNLFNVIETADFTNAGSTTYGTIAGTAGINTTIGGVQNFDGQLIVPPGAVLALFNTNTTTSWQYSGRLLWEEVPL
jgi:hypothetical protein